MMINKATFSILIVTIAFSVQCFPQSAKFTEIKRKPSPEISTDKNSEIIFPQIQTKNDSLDKIINRSVLAGSFRLPEVYDPDKPDEIVNQAVKDGLAGMSYHVKLNKKGILSFYICEYICRGNCASVNKYFNFNLNTGKHLTVFDLIKKDSLQKFFDKIKQDKYDSLEAYKTGLKKNIDAGKDNMAPELYDWAMKEYVDKCEQDYMQGQYYLTESGIMVMDECVFPEALSKYQPGYTLFYSYASLSQWMNPAYMEKIAGKKKKKK